MIVFAFVIFWIIFALVTLFFDGEPWLVPAKKVTTNLIDYAMMCGGQNIQLTTSIRRNN